MLHWVLLPTRRDADVREAKHSLDSRPFTDIVPLDCMAGVLQQVTQGESTDSPVPG